MRSPKTRTGVGSRDDSLDGTALPDSVREVIGARVGRLGQDAERVLSVAAVIGRDFDLDVLARATKTSEDDLLDLLDAAIAVSLVREVADTGRYNFAHALDSTHPLRRPRSEPSSARASTSRRSPRSPLRRSSRRPGRGAGPALVPRHPTHRPGQGHRLLPPSRRRGPRARSLPPMRCATTPRPSSSTPRTTTIRPSGSTWRSGSAPHNVRPATRRFGTRSSDAARWAAASATPNDSLPLPWPTTAGTSPRSGPSTPTRSRSWRWRSSGSPLLTPTGRSCSRSCARSSRTAARSSDARRSPTKRSPSPNLAVTTRSSCGSSTTSRFRSSCRRCSINRWPGRPMPSLAPSGSATRRCSFGRLSWRGLIACQAGDIDEYRPLFEMSELLADRLDQPLSDWGQLFTRFLSGADRRETPIGPNSSPGKHSSSAPTTE